MSAPTLGPKGEQALEQVLGYLNFSSGANDPGTLQRLDGIFHELEELPGLGPTHLALGRALQSKLDQLAKVSPTFRDSAQAQGVLNIVWGGFFDAYREFHADLLFHQTDEALFRSFFVGRVFEAVLAQGPSWDETERIVSGAITKLNDFVGYRPTAVLESKKVEPYPREWVRPIPLYVREAGVARGPEQAVVEMALDLLRDTDSDLLQTACFEPDLLDELSVDPRAYDFDHPINKRPNYHFGLWDTHQIDNQGRFRRFVVQQVTLDSLLARMRTDEAPQEELLSEAAAVLAGTILMAAAICGRGPGHYDSTTTLALLLPPVARMRDEFYERLIQKLGGPHAERLRIEAAELRQPFGGARQHLNAELARRRATQLEHLHLARLYARMGYVEQAAREVEVVSVASGRLQCQLDCLLARAERLLERGKIAEASDCPEQAIALLHRGIECGAIVDPWNILGFDAHFSLFPALENSVHDHRVDELVGFVERLFGTLSRLWSEAAAGDHQDLCMRVDQRFQDFSNWWRKYAAHEVESVDCADPQFLYDSARHVARALNLWHKGGAATGDVKFWAPYADLFDSPKGYALVIDALLHRRDYVASLALLTHWLGQAERVPLEQGECSFHEIAENWLAAFHAEAEPNSDDVCADDVAEESIGDDTTPGAAPQQHAGQPRDESDSAQAGGSERPAPAPDVAEEGENHAHDPERWRLLERFFDCLEANAEDYWQAPSFEIASRARNGIESLDETEDEEEPEDEDNLFGAAYEDMVFRDSTDDGVESELSEFGDDHDDELTNESHRLSHRLAFISNLARLWKNVAIHSEWRSTVDPQQRRGRRESLLRWAGQAVDNREGLLKLLDEVRNHLIPAGFGDHDSMLEYDRRRLLKESLLDRIVVTCVETLDAARLLSAAAHALSDEAEVAMPGALAETHGELASAVRACAAIFRGDTAAVRQVMPDVLESLARCPLLYVPLSKGGDPRAIVSARMRQRIIYDLLVWLPRAGLILESCQLMEAAREMERSVPVGPGAVTEYDELFAAGYRSLVEALIHCRFEGEDPQNLLVELLEKLTESLLLCWLAHSRTLRLSVLEKVGRPREWKKLVAFIKRYGDELFTQRFLNIANVRGILHQGVDEWIDQVEEFEADEIGTTLLQEIDSQIPRRRVVECMTLILEAIIENYTEYRDYNSTTTQSDRGELLYMLLDFLRLRTQYDRVAWNLRPVVWAHEVLVRNGFDRAAASWREALTERVKKESDSHLRRLENLQRKYAMRMPTVADRLHERFVKPLEIDSIRALVGPAIEEARRGLSDGASFQKLDQATQELTQQPSGVGLDVPTWLMALEEEVEAHLRPHQLGEEDIAHRAEIPRMSLGISEVSEQLDKWCVEGPGSVLTGMAGDQEEEQ